MTDSEEIGFIVEETDELGKRDQSQTTNTSAENQGQPRKRVRNSSGQRTYICGCSKTYLSYPAIYTHVKNKHGGTYPPGSIVPKSNGTSRDASDLGRIGGDPYSFSAKLANVAIQAANTEFGVEAEYFLKQIGVPAACYDVNCV